MFVGCRDLMDGCDWSPRRSTSRSSSKRNRRETPVGSGVWYRSPAPSRLHPCRSESWKGLPLKKNSSSCSLRSWTSRVPEKRWIPASSYGSGLCHGIIYGGCEGEPPYLSDILAIHWRDEEPTSCGTKLLALAQALPEAGCFDLARVWTPRRLIDLMLAARNSDECRCGRRRLDSRGREQSEVCGAPWAESACADRFCGTGPCVNSISGQRVLQPKFPSLAAP